MIGIAHHRLAVAVALALTACPRAGAQPAAPADSRDKLIRQLIQRVESLEGQVKDLKTKPPGAPAAATGDTGAALEHDDAVRAPRFPDVQFHGFGDVRYRFSDLEGQKNSFALGQLDLFLTSQLAENLSVLDEMVVEARSDNKFGFEIERLQLMYTPSDYFNIAAGRYHTAIGYYNTAYHHGTWFQTAVGRPFVFGFEDEGGVMPVHNVGLSINGHIPSGQLGLRYIVEVGNGRHYGAVDEEPVLNVADDNSYKAVNVALIARPDWAPGWQFGVSAYHDTLTPEGLPRIAQTILDGHVVYQSRLVEWLNEGYLFRHDAHGTDSTHYTPGFYTQLSRKFGPFRPYLRYQYQNAPESDLIFSTFSDAGLIHGPTVGLRYDFSEMAALKAQYDRVIRGGSPTVNELTLQACFTF